MTTDTTKLLVQGAVDLDTHIVSQLQADAIYSGYAKRQTIDMQAVRRDEKTKIPDDIVFQDINGLSSELIKKLCSAGPKTIAQAAKVDGITPAALILILGAIKKAGPKIKNAG